MAKEPGKIDLIEFPANGAGGVSKAKAFYAKAFGWTFTDWGEDYADTSGGGLPSGFNGDPEHRPSAPLAVVYSANLQESRRTILALGGTVTRDVFEFPGGRRFHFKDPIGNELAVWSDK